MTTTTFQIHPAQLVKLIGSVLKLASTDITLPILSAVLLRRQGNYLTATATDRYALGVCRDYFDPNLDQPADGWRFLLSLPDAKALLKLARAALKAKRPVIPIQANDIDLVIGYDGEVRAGNVEFTTQQTYPKTDAVLFRILSRLARVPQVGGLNLGRMAQFVDAGLICGDRLGMSTIVWDASPKPIAGFSAQPQWAIRIGEDFVGAVMGIRVPGSQDVLRDVSDWKDLLK